MERFIIWLENRWVAPAYSGSILLGLAIFFFGAASNTMAGWLYVISGTILAVLAIAAVLPERILRDLTITRRSIVPVHAGEAIVVEITIANEGRRARELLQITDVLPYVLGKPQTSVIEAIPANGVHHWVYSYPTTQRGIYAWNQLQLRTAAPLGLFWRRRSQITQAQAVVYPQILPLNRCPILDEVGETPHVYVEQYAQSNQSHEGFTRALRPYRWGDPIRLVHWRTSARYGELRVRELEILTGGEEVVIALDPKAPWVPDYFEQAVVAAATLVDYGDRHGLKVGIWTGTSGVVYSRPAVLKILAKVCANEEVTSELPNNLPVIWLTTTSTSTASLPEGSRTITWPKTAEAASNNDNIATAASVSSQINAVPASVTSLSTSMVIDPLQDLASQLQQEL